MTDPAAAELAAAVQSVDGVVVVYPAHPLLDAVAAVAPFSARSGPVPRIGIDDERITVRVGIDRTRTIVAIARDVHVALRGRLASGPLAATPIHLEIATLR